jgi:hypothetical protein
VLEFEMSDDYTDFDCPNFLSSVLVRFRTPTVCYYQEGSTIVALEMDSDVAAAAIGDPKGIGIPTLIKVTDPATGQSRAVPTGLPVGWIIFLVFLMLMLAAIGLLIFLCCKKKKAIENGEGGHTPLREDPIARPLVDSGVRYEPVREYDSDYGSDIGGYSPSPAASQVESQLISCRIVHFVEATDDSVLPVEEGEIVQVLPADFNDHGEWVWVKHGPLEGYVPRTALLRV